MEIIKNIESVKNIKSCVITLGSFDGLHLGHLKILKKTISISKKYNIPSVLLTFNPHPKEILEPDNKDGFLLTSLKDKCPLISTMDISYLFIIPFNKNFSKITANNFLNNILKQKFNPKAIVIGYNHHFGFNRDGNPDFLKNYCELNKINLNIVGPEKINHVLISSTYIRNLIKNGKVKIVKNFLGRFYGFDVLVKKGSGRGAKLGFPTANLVPIEKKQQMPGTGVYFVKVRFIGLKLYGMCNFGIRPTFKEEDIIMEAHIFHKFDIDLYGKKIRIEFLERIREEIKFNSPNELQNQLMNDKEICLTLKKNYK